MTLAVPHSRSAADCLAALGAQAQGLSQAEASMAGIRSILAPHAAVLREGKRMSIAAVELVVDCATRSGRQSARILATAASML